MRSRCARFARGIPSIPRPLLCIPSPPRPRREVASSVPPAGADSMSPTHSPPIYLSAGITPSDFGRLAGQHFAVNGPAGPGTILVPLPCGNLDGLGNFIEGATPFTSSPGALLHVPTVTRSVAGRVGGGGDASPPIRPSHSPPIRPSMPHHQFDPPSLPSQIR